ncbi:MAG TPA: HyaD/HybD family hydrogenase maturation endopeptidase [Desulfobacteria bacterium]|nr:HyaD/HybD family hydrogenase maturation endopeptidase [Desulfobacteria bacterium]
MDKQLEKIMIMGVGNVLLSDEGAGVHLLSELAKYSLPENVELLEGGTAGMEMLHLFEDLAHLIIVDSINAGAEPGAIFKFKPDDISVIPPQFNVSFHQVGLLEVLKMAQIFGKLPKTVTIFGIQPASLDWGMELTPKLKEKLPQLAQFVVDEAWSLV